MESGKSMKYDHVKKIFSRYKCCDCDNYDLCEKCHNDGQHSQHKMMKILSPFAVCTGCGEGRNPIIDPRLIMALYIRIITLIVMFE